MSIMLTLMCGIPRCGKSTWISKNKKDAIIVSPDDIRKEIFGHQFFNPGEPWIWAFTKSMIRLLMIQKKDVIINATNLFPWLRREWLCLAYELNYKAKMVLIDTPIEVCMKRNKKESHKVPLDKMMLINSAFIKPEDKEGFDKLVVVKKGN